MKKILNSPWLLWGSAALFFAYQFILRLAPGLVMPQIMEKFHIQALDYGFFSSLYYVGYSGAQIPIALLLEKFGPRRVLPFCALICTAATFLFVHTDSWNVVLFSRFWVGVASAAGFLGVSKVISQVFPKEKYARIVGYSFTLGLMGAVYGGKPVSSLISAFGWKTVLDGAAFFSLGIAALLFLLLRGCQSSEGESEKGSSTQLSFLLKHPSLFILGLCTLLMVGPLEGFADVWGVAYFMKALQMSKSEAAGISSMIFVGMLFGGPILASLAEKWGSYFKVTALCGFLMAAAFAGMLAFVGEMHVISLYVLMFMVGVMCCYQVLIFAIGTKIVGPTHAGITVALLNCINMLGGSFFHSTIGLVLDSLWSGNLENGARDYLLSEYSTALWVIPIAAFLGGVALVILGRKQSVSVTA